MGLVGVTINGRDYSISCDEGKEDRLRDLAATLDKKVEELVAASGQIGDTRLLVMAGLLFADELAEAEKELDRLRAENERLTSQERAVDTRAIGDALTAVALRIERVAERLEGT